MLVDELADELYEESVEELYDELVEELYDELVSVTSVSVLSDEVSLDVIEVTVVFECGVVRGQ